MWTRINIFFWCVAILLGIRSCIYYQHDKAVARNERGSLELGLVNVTETNSQVAQDVEKIRNDVRQMIFFDRNTTRIDMDRLAANDQILKSKIEALHYELKHLRKILDDIIGLSKNNKRKSKKKKKK